MTNQQIRRRLEDGFGHWQRVRFERGRIVSAVSQNGEAVRWHRAALEDYLMGRTEQVEGPMA